MLEMTNLVAIDRGTRAHSAALNPAYAPAWKQRPSVVILGGVGTENSTGVSAEERLQL